MLHAQHYWFCENGTIFYDVVICRCDFLQPNFTCNVRHVPVCSYTVYKLLRIPVHCTNKVFLMHKCLQSLICTTVHPEYCIRSPVNYGMYCTPYVIVLVCCASFCSTFYPFYQADIWYFDINLLYITLVSIDYVCTLYTWYFANP